MGIRSGRVIYFVDLALIVAINYYAIGPYITNKIFDYELAVNTAVLYEEQMFLKDPKLKELKHI
jgi:hypothetical protein